MKLQPEPKLVRGTPLDEKTLKRRKDIQRHLRTEASLWLGHRSGDQPLPGRT